MPKILLLTSVAGDGPVSGDAGAVLEVSAADAKVWADGVRAERWTGSEDQRQYRAELGADDA